MTEKVKPHVIAKGIRETTLGLYYLRLPAEVQFNAIQMEDPANAELWHCRTDYLNFQLLHHIGVSL